MPISPVSRTKEVFKKLNIPIDNAQHWIPFHKEHPLFKKGIKGMRKDLFGIIDLIAIRPHSVCGIQVCGSDFAAHDTKILDSAFAYKWLKTRCLSCGFQRVATLELWGWRQLRVPGIPKQKKWEPRIKVYKLEDFE